MQEGLLVHVPSRQLVRTQAKQPSLGFREGCRGGRGGLACMHWVSVSSGRGAPHGRMAHWDHTLTVQPATVHFAPDNFDLCLIELE